MREKTKFEIKIEEMVEKAKEKAGKAYTWAKDNKETLYVIVPVLATSGVELIKIILRSGNVKEQKELKDLYVYDRRSGHYYQLKRKLKNREWIEFDERKNRGENVAQILQDMRVLK